MKKFFLIILAGGLAISASAQNFGRHYDNTPDHRKLNVKERRELDRRIATIKADYNSRINSVKHQPLMRNGERRRKIKELIRQRDVAIDRCMNNFSRPYASGFDRRHH